jgi:hypothetical protein
MLSITQKYCFLFKRTVFRILAEGAAGNASGEGGREGSGTRSEAGRPGIADLPRALSTKV